MEHNLHERAYAAVLAISDLKTSGVSLGIALETVSLLRVLANNIGHLVTLITSTTNRFHPNDTLDAAEKIAAAKRITELRVILAEHSATANSISDVINAIAALVADTDAPIAVYANVSGAHNTIDLDARYTEFNTTCAAATEHTTGSLRIFVDNALHLTEKIATESIGTFAEASPKYQERTKKIHKIQELTRYVNIIATVAESFSAVTAFLTGPDATKDAVNKFIDHIDTMLEDSNLCSGTGRFPSPEPTTQIVDPIYNYSPGPDSTPFDTEIMCPPDHTRKRKVQSILFPPCPNHPNPNPPSNLI